MNRRILKTLTLATVPFALLAAPPTPPPRQPARLAVPTYLPDTARALLHDKMKRHAADATQLVSAVTLLQHRSVQEVATRMASEPTLARPAGEGDESLNALLPPAFFELQARLKQHELDLAAAAQHEDDAQMAAAFGRTMQDCVSCHSIYLRKSP